VSLPPGGERRRLERALAAALGSGREARWVLEDLAGTDDPVSAEAAGLAEGLAERRRGGEPLQYVLGHWPFRELDLLVDPRALIPRPETEWLTDVALAELDRLLASKGRANVVDLGTGTGAIALSIATERAGRGVSVTATDCDPDALDLARANELRVRTREGGARVEFRLGRWWEALPVVERGCIDLVVSNPPYVDAVEWEQLDPVVRDHEPHGALVAGPGSDYTPGFVDIEAILVGAAGWLARPGTAVLEIAPSQADAALRAAAAQGSTGHRVLADLADRPRALVAHWG